MITEELKVKLTLDTTGVSQDIAKVKNQLKSVEGTSGATAGATESMAELQNTMKAIVGLEFADLMAENASAISDFGKRIKESFKGVKDHVSNAFDSLNPKSSLYKNDVEWEGWGNALKNFTANMREARDESTNFGKAMKNLGNTIRPVTAGLTVLGAVLVPIAGTLSAFSVSQLGKDIYNSAQRVGMGTQKYQEWSYILEHVGADITDLIGAQQTLTEAQLDVAEGSEDIIEAFKHIGISAEEVVKMDRQELFERTIAGLQNIENSTERAAVGYRLLSEDANTLSALLGMSNQDTAQLANNFNLLGSVMSESLIKKSLTFRGALGSLGAAFQGLKNTLAEVFLPILTTVVTWLTKAIAVVNMFLRALFNMELTTTGTSNVTSGGIEGFNSYTDAVEGTESAVQKLRRTLMGFDELNVVDNPNSSSGGASGGSGGGTSISGGGGLGDSLISAESLGLDKWRTKIEEWKGVIQTLVPIAMIGIGAIGAVMCLMGGNWAGALAFATMAGIGFAAASADGGLWDKLRGQIEKLNLELPLIVVTGLATLAALWLFLTGNIPAGFAMATVAGIGIGVIRSGDGWGGLIENIKSKLTPLEGIIIGVLTAIAAFVLGGPVLKAIKIGWGLISTFFTTKIAPKLSMSFFTNLLKSIPTVVSNKLAKVKTAIESGWKLIANYFKTNIAPKFTSSYWVALFDTIRASLSTKLGEARLVLINVWNNIAAYFKTNIAPKFTSAYWTTKFDTIRAGLNTKLGEARTAIINAWNNVRNYFSTNIAPKFTTAYWGAKFDTIRAGIATKLGEARTTIINGWNSVREYFTTNVAPKFTSAYWSTKFDTIRASLATKLGEAKNAVVNGWGTIKTYFDKNISPKFTANYWSNKFGTIKDGAKSAFNGVISIIEKAINAIVNKVNTVSWKIPDWVPKYGGSRFGFNLNTIKIPRLATGGIAVNSTLANIGENGKEAILPLENNTAWMDTLAEKIAARNGSPTKIVLKVGERELGWATIDSINKITKQTGGLQLEL